jgi:hypothetical protein
MRTIHVMPPVAVALLLWAPLSIRAQGEQPALVGMPEYGVALSGSLEDPVLENHSGRVVIGYDMKLSAANGWVLILPAQIMAHSVLPAGIPDGGAIYVHGNVPVGFQRVARTGARWPGQGLIVRATLRSIVFGDGQFVGTDYQGAFELFGKQLKAVREVGVLPKRHAWVLIEAVAQLPSGGPFPFMANYLMSSFRRVAVSLLMNGWHGWDALTAEFWGQGNSFAYDGLAIRVLVDERRRRGDAAAARLAELYSSLPTLWK